MHRTDTTHTTVKYSIWNFELNIYGIWINVLKRCMVIFNMYTYKCIERGKKTSDIQFISIKIENFILTQYVVRKKF